MIGFLNLTKPAGVTAHDVVSSVRRLLRIKQIGHAGTLDPMATGVLPIAVGKACRLLRFLPGDKTYVAEILLGQTTDTDDIEGQTISSCDQIPDAADIRQALSHFQGPLQQMPPLYSAIHHQGQRLYALARSGVIPEGIQPRSVTIKQLEILELAPPVVRIRVACTAGTYIRSIARDLGQNLGCGGCLKALVREQAGPFGLKESLTLDQLGTTIASDKLSEVLIPPQDVLGLSRLELDTVQAALIRNGRQVQCDPHENDHLIAALHEGSLVAVCRSEPSGMLQPEVVISSGE